MSWEFGWDIFVLKVNYITLLFFGWHHPVKALRH